jgi:penicillin-binding protein 2
MLFFDRLKKDDPQLRVVAWSVLAGMLVLMGGLWYVQVLSYRHYTENQKAQSYRTVRIPAIRGKILDRNSQALAENQPVYNINLYIDELRPVFKSEWRRTAPKTRMKLAERRALEAQTRYRVASNVVYNLARTLREPLTLEYERFTKHYQEQLALPLTVMSNLAPAQIARFQEHPSELPGLDLDIQPTRFYPQRTTGAHIVGYLKRDDSSIKDEDAFFNFRLPDYKGDVGVERFFDEYLHGRAGAKSVLVNNLGYRQSETIWTPAEPGKNVVLTLDLNLQAAVEKALQTAAPLAIPGPLKAAAVVMDPNNGDVFALASIPSYDPNLFIPRVNAANWQRLNDPEFKPMRNRATQENYQPGSIFKIVTALALLEAGINPAATIENPGHIFVGRRRIDDTAPAGTYNFRRGFIKSSNTYFITNALRAGVQKIVEIGHRLHLGEPTRVPTHQDNPGIFPTMKSIQRGWFDGHTANLAIGQGDLAVTPLQMAVMISAIANGGKVYWPRLVERIEPQDTTLGEGPRIYPKGRLRDQLRVSPRNLQLVREAMLADVEDADEGTGRLAAVPGMRICGKTGTAQITDFHGNVIDWTTWFASYAPYENPRYVVIVAVESGKSGGLTCAPVAQKIYQAIQYYEQQQQARPVTKLASLGGAQ